MGDLEQHYGAKIKVIRINVDDPQAQAALRKYNVRGTPTIVLLNRQGQVAANVPGFAGEQALGQALDRLIGGP